MSYKPYHKIIKKHYAFLDKYYDKRIKGLRLSYVGHGGTPDDGKDSHRARIEKGIVKELKKNKLPFIYAKWVISKAVYGRVYKFVLMVP